MSLTGTLRITTLRADAQLKTIEIDRFFNTGPQGDKGDPGDGLNVQKPLIFQFSAPNNFSLFIVPSAVWAGTVDALMIGCELGGSIDAQVFINGTPVTGLETVTASSPTLTVGTATGANSVELGDEVRIDFSNASSPVQVRGQLVITQTA